MSKKLINEGKLLAGVPIEIPNMGIVYPPKLKDFMDFDFLEFKNVFSIRKELIIDTIGENSEYYNKIKDFDLIPAFGKERTLIRALKLLYKTDDVKFLKDLYVVSIKVGNNKYYINRDNYTEFSNMILIMLHDGNNIADEKVKEELTEFELKAMRGRRKLEKKRAERRKERNEEENVITIFDIANYVMHSDESRFDYQSILDLTIYQLINTLNQYQAKEKYKTLMSYKTSSNFKVEENINHWFFGE